MTPFETINTITEDLLRIIRSSRVSSSEVISKRQLENWVHQYRALLLSRDLNQKLPPNPDYMQTVKFDTSLASNYEDFGLTENIDKLVVTDINVPKTIDLKRGSGIRFIGVNGTEIPLYPQFRSQWQSCRRYTGESPYAFLLDNKLYIMNAESLKGNNSVLNEVKLIGIFEDPMEVISLNNPDATIDVPYPVPNNKVPTIKEMVLSKEFDILVQAPSDNINNSNSDI